MAKALVFAGTTEGGDITEVLAAAGVKVHACVATEYGRTSVRKAEGIEVSAHPLAHDEMLALMKEYPVVVDATHPYASRISQHVREACAEAGADYIRLVRPGSDAGGAVIVGSVREAAEYLSDKEGNILATTGSKELSEYTAIPDYRNRVFARVLSLPKVAEECAALGFEGKNIFLMQGPFCEGAVSDFPASRATARLRFTNRIAREIVLMHVAFFRFRFEPIEHLRFLQEAEGRNRADLRFAAGE